MEIARMCYLFRTTRVWISISVCAMDYSAGQVLTSVEPHVHLKVSPMIHTTRTASRLAYSKLNTAVSRATIRAHAVPAPSPLAKPRHLSILTSNSLGRRAKTFVQGSTANYQVRKCSQRRAMCRGNADIPGGSVDVDAYREVLPKNVKPLHYDLTLEPNFEVFSYEGKVAIEYVR